MSECTIRGCRTLSTKCDDCGRTVSTCGAKRPVEDGDWYDVENFPPAHGLPCEYQIVVRVRGWALRDGDKTEFMPHQGLLPESKIMSYRKWDGPRLEEGFAMNEEINALRQKEIQAQMEKE